jgi:hypothetical protein
MTLDHPQFFFNVVNSINIATAPSWPLHRMGGAYFNDYVFLSIPRTAPNGFYLDMEVNPLTADANNPNSLVYPQGFTWGLGGDVIQGRILSRIEAFNSDAPTIIWVETCFVDGSGPVQTATFKYMVPKFGAGSMFPVGVGPLEPTAADINTLTFDGQPAQVLDFTTANAQGTIYLFWTAANQNAIWWAEFDGSKATARGQLIQLPSTTIPSIDATSVQIIDPVTGEQTTRLAVVAMTTDPNDNAAPPQLFGWLFDPTSGAMVRPVNLPEVPQPPETVVDAFSSTIRATWGTLAAGNATATNGLVLSYVPSHGNPGFDAAAGFSGTNINGLGPLFVNTVDLANGDAANDWTKMDPNADVWGDKYTATSAPLSVLFPIPIPASGQNTVTYYVGNAASAISIDVVTVGRTSAFPPTPRCYLNVLCSFTLTRTDSGEPQSSVVQENFNEDDIVAALGSWTLIGMITGLPPYFSEQDPDTVSFTYAIETSAQNESELSTSKSVTSGATVGPVEGSVARAVVNSDDSTTDTDTNISIIWSNSGTGKQHNLPADHGVALFWRPAYQCATYSMTNAVEQKTNLTLSMIWASGSGEIGYNEFSLTNPTNPVDNSDLSQAFAASFPSANGQPQITWPRSDNPKAWAAFELPPLTQLMSSQPTPVQIGSGGITESLQFGTSTATSVENDLTISLSVDANAFEKVLGLSLNVGAELSMTSTVRTTLGRTQTFTLSYGSLPATLPYESIGLSPQLLQPTADGAPWVPGHNAAQRPWLLTWLVNSLIKKQ